MTLTRRDFIKTSTTLAATLGAVPDFLVRTSLAEATSLHQSERVLVVIQLTGGNDGLNTVVPHEDDHYGRSRPTMRLPKAQLHKVDNLQGFHPRMTGFKELYDQGRLGIVQNVGLANLSRDHEAALKAWHGAGPEPDKKQTGWLGRTADKMIEGIDVDMPIALVSSINRPFVLTGAHTVIPRLHSMDALSIQAETGHSSRGRSPVIQNRNNDDLLEFVRRRHEESMALSERIQTVRRESSNRSGYPAYGLAQNLNTIAQMIRARSGIRIYFTELGGDGFGGFDNHANQIGNHCALLHQLSESVSAFVADLEKSRLLDNVLLMTFSEFGRTITENGRRGTNHGAAAPVFIAGGQLRDRMIGSPPDLANPDNDAIRHEYDFRQVYATVLEQWLGLESHDVLNGKFNLLPFV